MTHQLFRILGLPLSLAVASFASAATLATPIRFQPSEDVSVSCRINNVGAKPVLVKGARVLGNTPGAGTNFLDTCTGVSIAPDATCTFLGGTESGYVGAAIEVKGSGKSLRGLCTVSADGVAIHHFELR